MADRKITIEVTDNDSISNILSKIDKANAGFDKMSQKAKGAIGGSVAAGKAGSQVGIGSELPGYGVARAAVGTGAAGRDFAEQSRGLGGLVHVYATFAANIFAVGAAFRALKSAMDVSILTKSMDVLSVSIGTNLKAIATEMTKAAQGAISLQESMRFTSMAATAGFTAKNIQELTEVAKGASAALGRDLSDSMDRLFRGVVKVEPELLDELGLMTKVNDAARQYSATVGKSVESLSSFEKRQAFLNAVVAEGKQKFDAASKSLEVNPYSKLAASLQNAATQILNTINTILGPVAKIFAENTALLNVAILGLVGMLLNRALPALANYGRAVKQTSKEANDAFLASTEQAQKQMQRYSALREAQFNKRFDRDVKEPELIQKSRLVTLQNDIAATFRNGIMRGAVEGATSVSEAIDAVNKRSVTSKLRATNDMISAAKVNGESTTELDTRKARLESILSIINNQDAAYKKMAASIAAINDKEARRAAVIAADSGNVGGRSRIGAAGIEKVNTISLNKVTEMSNFAGPGAAFTQLMREIDKAGKRYAAAAKTYGGEVTSSMNIMGKATLFASGSFAILGKMAAGAFAAISTAMGVIGVLIGAFTLLASVTGGFAKGIDDLRSASTATADSFEIMKKVSSEVNKEFAAGFTDSTTYIANLERLTNAQIGFSEAVDKQVEMFRKYRQEGTGWATDIVEWFNSFTKAGNESQKLTASLQTRILKTKQRADAAGASDAFQGTFYQLSKDIDSGDFDKQSAAAQKLKAIEEAISIVERNRVAAFKDAKEAAAQVTAEIMKHRTEGEKFLENTQQLVGKFTNLAEQLKKGVASGNSNDIMAVISAFTDQKMIRAVGNMGAEFKAAATKINDLTGAGMATTLKSILGNRKDLELASEQYNLTPSSSQGDRVKNLLTDLRKSVVAAMETLQKDPNIAISSKQAGMAMGANVLNGISSQINNINTPGAKIDLSFTNSIDGLIKDKVTPSVKEYTDAMIAFAEGMARAERAAKAKYQEDEYGIKLMTEQISLSKLQADVAQRAISQKTKTQTGASQQEILNYEDALVKANKEQLELKLKQINLDYRKAVDAGGVVATEQKIAAMRRNAAQQAAKDDEIKIKQLVEQERLSNELAVLDKEANKKSAELDFRSQTLEMLKETRAISGDEYEQMKLTLQARKEAADDEKNTATEIAKASSAGDIERVALLQRQYSDRAKIRDITLEAARITLEENQAMAKNNELLAEKMGLLREVASTLESSFGSFGKALGGMANAFAGMQEGFAKIDTDLKAKTSKMVKGSKEELDAYKTAEAAKTRLTLKSYGDMAGAAKGYFKEHTGAYKVLNATEKAFRTAEMAMALEAFLVKIGFLEEEVLAKMFTSTAKTAIEGTETAASVANSGIRASAFGTEAIANAFAKIPAPFNFVVAGAVLAALIAAGVKMKGGKGAPAMSAAQRQETQGTGTVLGDSSAKSNSLSNSLKILKENSASDLEYTSEMVMYLASIERSMSGLATMAVQAGLVTSNSASSSKYNLGTKQNVSVGGAIPIISPFLNTILGGLFGKTTRSLNDTGILINSQTVGQARTGISAGQYADITTTKKSWFGSSSSTSRDVTALSADFARQMSLVIDNMALGITKAATILGKNGTEIEKILNGLTISMTEISLKDLKGEEITKALEAVFSSIGDQLVTSVLPEMTAFQKVGEGLFETLTRTASGVQKADSVLRKFGITAIKWTDITNKQGDVASEIIRDSIIASETVNGILTGVGEILKQFDGTADELAGVYEKLRTIRTSMKLLGQDASKLSAATLKGAGGLTKFTDGLKYMTENWATDGQKFTSLTGELQNQFKGLGIAIPRSISDFEKLAITMSQDTSEAGQELYGALVALGPAFGEVIGAIDQALKTVEEMTMNSLETIMLDTATEQERYQYWKEKAEDLAKGAKFKDLMSPQEVTKQIEDATSAAMNAWGALDEAGKKSLKGYFEQYFKDLNDNAKLRLGELTDKVTGPTSQSPAQQIAAATTSGAKAIAEAFDLGTRRIADTLLGALTNPGGGRIGGGIGGIGIGTNPNDLSDFISGLKTENQEAARTLAVSSKNSSTALEETAAKLQQSVEAFQASVEAFNRGAQNVADAGDAPIKVDVSVKQDGGVSGVQVNM